MPPVVSIRVCDMVDPPPTLLLLSLRINDAIEPFALRTPIHPQLRSKSWFGRLTDPTSSRDRFDVALPLTCKSVSRTV